MNIYLYPQNLKTVAKLWSWGLRDAGIILIFLLISVFAVVNGIIFPAVITFCYIILTIRPDDISIMDYLKYAVRYFFTVQQLYKWRCKE